MHPEARSRQNLVLERTRDPSSNLFAASVAILAQSIPAEEQLPADRLTGLLARDDYQLHAYHSNSDVYAFALLYVPVSSDFAWLDYMAVRYDQRRQGIGSSLFREVVSLARREKGTPDWLLFEVDDDREGSIEMRRNNQRRIRFYRRLGALLLANVPYLFPNASGLSVPMRLMAYQLRQEAKLSPGYVRGAIERVFSAIHGRQLRDPLLRWIRDGTPRVVVLE